MVGLYHVENQGQGQNVDFASEIFSGWDFYSKKYQKHTKRPTSCMGK